MKTTVQKILMICAILMFDIQSTFCNDLSQQDVSNSFSPVLTTKTADIEDQNTVNNHTTSTITDAARACCLFNCVFCTTVTMIGAVWVPATLAIVCDQSQDLALASGVVNSIYLASNTFQKQDEEKSSSSSSYVRVINQLCLVGSTTAAWIYFAHGNDIAYQAAVGCSCTMATISTIAVAGTLCYSLLKSK